jgi:inner membrane protein
MTLTGHRATGLGAAAIAYSIAHAYHGLPWLAAALAIPGATAPDWLEIAWFKKGIRHSLIPHRTWTHWLLLWGALYSWALLSLQRELWASALLGFAVGAMVHLVMDLPNPSGIRFLHPFRQRVTLNWWRGDQMVWPMVWFSWLAGALSLHWTGVINLQPPLQLQAWLLQVWDLSLQRLRS